MLNLIPYFEKLNNLTSIKEKSFRNQRISKLLEFWGLGEFQICERLVFKFILTCCVSVKWFLAIKQI